MTELLYKTQDLVNRLNATNSSNDKLDILKQYANDEDIKELLLYVYSPYKQYGVTSANCKKKSELCHEQYLGSLICMLNNLETRVWTGHEAISYVNGFVSNYKEYEDLIYNILDKDLKTRANISLINKAIPNCIPVFKVALAEKYDGKLDLENETWYYSRKLDGVRCIIRKEGDSVKAYSRSGKEFHTLQNVLDDAAKISGDFVLDGELCLASSGNTDDFQGVMKEIRRKDHTIPNPLYYAFDYLTLEEFDSKVSTSTFRTRISELENTLVHMELNDTLAFLPQLRILRMEQVQDLLKEADDLGQEGIILRKDDTYKGKRSKDILKVKSFHDAEYTVKGIESGNIRHIVNGSEVESTMLSNVIIEHKGNEVGVGSGFSIEERMEFQADPSKIIGKVLTIQYFEESKNKEGEYSLRFPTVKIIHGDKRSC